MQFMVMIPADKQSKAEVMPDEKIFAEMGKFNEERVKVGVNWLPSMEVVLTKVE